MQTIAANQALDPNYFVVWGASESFNVAWAEAAGCDIDRFEFIETNIMEEMYAGIIDYLEDRACDCLVLDSYPALTPLDEDEADIGESRPGLGARTTNKFYRKQAPASRRSLTEEDRDCLLIIVNQWRSKIGVIFGDPRITPGGQGKDYACAIRAEFARDEWIKEGTGTDTVRVGITMRLHTIKNKTAPNERVAGVDFYFAPNALAVPPGCYDVAKDLYTAGVYYDIIEKAERGGGHTFLDQSWTSLAKMMASLREDLDLQAQLRYEILRSQGLDVEPPAKHRPAKRAAPRTRAPAKKSAPVVHMTKKR